MFRCFERVEERKKNTVVYEKCLEKFSKRNLLHFQIQIIFHCYVSQINNVTRLEYFIFIYKGGIQDKKGKNHQTNRDLAPYIYILW